MKAIGRYTQNYEARRNRYLAVPYEPLSPEEKKRLHQAMLDDMAIIAAGGIPPARNWQEPQAEERKAA